VFNDRGRVQVRAVVVERPRGREGLVIMPFGWLAEHSVDGCTVDDLTSDTPADFGGGVAFYDTSVQVVAVG
jgi:anaerobic selenocysteine-containing dehydrogenase